MKIIKAIDKKVGNTVYYKYKINLPKRVEDSDLLDKELKVSIEKNKITIEKDLKSNKFIK